MSVETTEISIKGKWRSVPALKHRGINVVVDGRFLKVAKICSEEWLPGAIENPEDFIGLLKSNKAPELHADLFTFTEKPPQRTPRHSYSVDWDSVAGMRTASYNEWWESLPQGTRKNVRRALRRGVEVRVVEFGDQLVRWIMEINDDCPMRQNQPFAHYKKTFEQVKKDHGSFVDRSEFLCAFFDGEIIGFVKIVYRGKTAAIMQDLPKISHNDKNPASVLISKAVERCAAKGIEYLTYGMYNYGNKKDSPLREFKIRNGFEEMLTPRYFVPLTLRGRLCLKLRLHRGPLGVLPHGVIKWLLSCRSKWYNLRHMPV